MYVPLYFLAYNEFLLYILFYKEYTKHSDCNAYIISDHLIIRIRLGTIRYAS